MRNQDKAKLILDALENGVVPISWHCMYDERLVEIIAKVLDQIDKQEAENA